MSENKSCGCLEEKDSCCCHEHEEKESCCHEHEHKEKESCCHEHEHKEKESCCHEHEHEHSHKHAHGENESCSCGCGGEKRKNYRGPEISCGCGSCSCGGEHGEEEGEGNVLAQIIIGAVLFAAGFIIHNTSLPKLLSLGVNLAAYLILGWHILLTAGRNILKGHVFDENFLMSIATIGAFVIGEFPEAVGVMLFFRVGEYFEERAVEKSRAQIMEAIDLRPETVNLLSGDERKTIPAEDARAGDLLLVRPGERIPLDGVVTEGASRADTSAINGEPTPLSLNAGDAVISGWVNISSQLKMRVEKPLSESVVSRILDSVENAAASKPKIDRFISRFARIYTPAVVIIALLTAILPPLFFHGSWSEWIYTALTFLVMSCPCALVLSVPLAYFAGIGAASRQGILFKGGASIEAMKKIKAVVMDKTGTLTRGSFRLKGSEPAAGLSETALLRLCASCESYSTHPVAVSILTAAKEQGLDFPAPKNVEELAGLGIKAELEIGEALCGNRRLLDKFGVALPETDDSAGTEVLCAVNGRFAGRLIIGDEIKPEAKSAVAELKRRGCVTVMLTGDTAESAAAVAESLGIDEVHARLLPHDKLDVMQKLREKHGGVMFVGDGINDAPVLAGADVGAAMGSGADAAIEAADVVFMTSNVDAIPQSLSIAGAANSVSMQNVVFALAIKFAVMLLGLLGCASMWAAVFADSGVAMLCVLNAIRILYKKK
ncbi:MAG: heavy metal translocating P-type ATPase [Clostridiales bacterium]|nr:heavy metal translocating P-type ATPase [Clostridiales bacterium]